MPDTKQTPPYLIINVLDRIPPTSVRTGYNVDRGMLTGGARDIDNDAEIDDVTPFDIDIMKKADMEISQLSMREQNCSSDIDELLGEAPSAIEDKFSSVVGDAFHFMDRPKVPIHHESKKSYFVALRDAWFAFDEVKLAELKDILESNGMSKEDIESKMYYDFDYFRKRVPRVVLPPSKHYWRVRAVFIVYGAFRW